MQDRYAGDVGDFGKFSLLAALHRALGGRLGVNWYRVDGTTEGNADGRHVAYPSKRAFVGLNDPLLGELIGVLKSGRSIAALEAQVSTLKGAALFGEPVPGKALKRRAWLKRARESVKHSRVIFLDPDNGVSPHADCGAKHACHDEIAEFLNVTDVLVIYHHLGRRGTHDAQIRSLLVQFQTTHPASRAFALRFRRGTSRAFLIAARRSENLRAARMATEDFLKKDWLQRGHFDPVIDASAALMASVRSTDDGHRSGPTGLQRAASG